VRSAPGRYLWLRLTLAGDGAATPELCRARVYAPRRSSLRFLPAVYREDAESRDFLDRFLSIFDTLRQEISDEIDDVPRLFDPLATPAAFLPWLASWLGLVLDRSWPEDRRRRLLQAAPRLFRLRGTAEGLRLYLRLYAGLEPAILEHFRLRRWLYLGSGRLGDRVAWGRAIVRRLELGEHSEIGTFQLLDQGDPTRDPFHHLAHRFTVYVPVCGGLGEAGREELRRQLRRIVELAKPAHTEGEVELVEPRFRIGSQSLVGVNTMIAAYPEGVVTGVSELGRGTLLGPSAEGPAPPTLQVGVRSRIGSSTLLD
jgi:phage tail-like protein